MSPSEPYKQSCLERDNRRERIVGRAAKFFTTLFVAACILIGLALFTGWLVYMKHLDDGAAKADVVSAKMLTSQDVTLQELLDGMKFDNTVLVKEAQKWCVRNHIPEKDWEKKIHELQEAFFQAKIGFVKPVWPDIVK